ncbi:MAG: PspC domain-containing protein [Ruminococcus sp.]|nr:PspC domain-containing protein [Ruminococcus sp.]
MRKTLYKIRQGRIICGVCNGLAEYFDVDVNVVRLGTVILACCSGVGLVAYIVAAVILPEA